MKLSFEGVRGPIVIGVILSLSLGLIMIPLSIWATPEAQLTMLWVILGILGATFVYAVLLGLIYFVLKLLGADKYITFN